MPGKVLIIKSFIEFVFPSFAAAIAGWFGSPLASAIAIGFITKLLLLLFDKQVRSLANKLKSFWKKYVLKLFKKN